MTESIINGIKLVGPDYSNTIVQNPVLPYTATQDCWYYCVTSDVNNELLGSITIDGIHVFYLYLGNRGAIPHQVNYAGPLLKGQTLNATNMVVTIVGVKTS